MEKKICLIIPYFGVWPIYFDLFLHSVADNEIVDVLLFTDIPYTRKLPKNVRMIRLSLSEFCGDASKEIGISVNIDNPYKLCDFRPSYGLIFNQYIIKYSHWAFGDIDVLYGDIAKFLPEMWWDFDILTFREEWLSGSFTVLQNSEYVNNLFRKSISYKNVLEADRHFGFDECWNLYDLLVTKDSDEILVVDKKQSFTWLVRYYKQLGHLNVFQRRMIKESIPAGDYVLYKNGKISQKNGREYLYYHYIIEKRKSRFAFPNWDCVPEKFIINRYGFYTADEFYSWHKYIFIVKQEIHSKMYFVKSFPSRAYNKLNRMTSTFK